MLSSEKPLTFHDKVVSLPVGVVKCLKILKNIVIHRHQTTFYQ